MNADSCLLVTKVKPRKWDALALFDGQRRKRSALSGLEAFRGAILSNVVQIRIPCSLVRYRRPLRGIREKIAQNHGQDPRSLHSCKSNTGRISIGFFDSTPSRG